MTDTKLKIHKILDGSTSRPRVSVFRSNYAISAQIIDDSKGITVFSNSTKKLSEKGKPTELAKLLGLEIAKIAKAKKITEMVFDRNGMRYHGRVKSLADGIREGGIKL